MSNDPTPNMEERYSRPQKAIIVPMGATAADVAEGRVQGVEINLAGVSSGAPELTEMLRLGSEIELVMSRKDIKSASDETLEVRFAEAKEALAKALEGQNLVEKKKCLQELHHIVGEYQREQKLLKKETKS